MRRCRSGAADHIAAANAAVSFAPAPQLRGRGVGRNFPEMCVMKPTFAVCAAVVGLLALSQSAAIAEQKTARQCNDDWSANKASIQASGKTKRVFMAECRGVALAAPAFAAAPAEKGQYATEAEAKASCPTDVV